MPRWHIPNSLPAKAAAAGAWARHHVLLIAACFVLLCFGVSLAIHSSRTRTKNLVANRADPDPDSSPPAPSEPRLERAELWNQGKPREVFATWYDVPEDSLAKRRAGSEEFTAAHNRLPIGTLVRVTHLQNGKTVLVRITDRGIHSNKVQLDLCKEAAEQLEMVIKGLARVRMQVLVETELPGGSVAEAQTTAAVP